jgi:hypothetical protein
MALKLPNLFGSERRKASDIDFDMPTTQVKMNQAAQQGYDPLASVSIMDQLRTRHDRLGCTEKALADRQSAGDQAVQILGL